MRKSISSLLRPKIYACIYGAEGTGKTCLAASLSEHPKGRDIGVVTMESSGPTPLLTHLGLSEVQVELIETPQEMRKDEMPEAMAQFFEPVVSAINVLARDKTIKVILWDGVTVFAGHAIDFLSGGRGEKSLGYDGWDAMLTGFRSAEMACDRASSAGRSVIITGWERPPSYVDTLAGSVLNEKGRMLLQGQAKVWVPGKCDVVGRLTSRFVTKAVPGGKPTKVYEGRLQVHASEEWSAKTRWTLPEPCPANLAEVLKLRAGAAAKAK